jgi:type II secretory pathway component HofQ
MIARSSVVALALLAGVAGAWPAPAAVEDEARLSIDLREGELRQILAALAEIGGFQLVVDPDVSCRLTLKLERLAWRQVLSQVLRACGLGQEADGNLVRVAPLERLAAEARDRRLAAEFRGGDPPRAVTLRLSYARAEELAPLVESLLGPDSRAVYDRRTNTLILIQP